MKEPLEDVVREIIREGWNTIGDDRQRLCGALPEGHIFTRRSRSHCVRCGASVE